MSYLWLSGSQKRTSQFIKEMLGSHSDLKNWINSSNLNNWIEVKVQLTFLPFQLFRLCNFTNSFRISSGGLINVLVLFLISKLTFVLWIKFGSTCQHSGVFHFFFFKSKLGDATLFVVVVVLCWPCHVCSLLNNKLTLNYLHFRQSKLFIYYLVLMVFPQL